MSYTEIRHREGMPHGGMPHDALLLKLEETDPELVDEVRGFDEFHAREDDYDNYVRSEIIDWTPDAPYLESDQTRRDPALSRSMLNLRYNGTRGSNPELPRHPELFYGFTGNDPRGVVNDPRFDQMRGHMATRAAGLTVRMGNNDDHHLAERPWTGQSISYAMKEVHRRQKANTRVFSVQKEGRPWGNNTTFDAFAAGDLRAAAMGAGGESLAYRDAGAGPGPAPERFAGGDHGPADEAWTDGVRGVDASHFGGAEVAPWRHTTGDADLGVEQYGQKRGAGRSTVAPAAQGGGRLKASAADQDWAESARARSTNRQALAATMATAARHRRAVKSGGHDQDPGQSYEAAAAPGSGLAPARDVALLYRHVVEDQSRRPGGEIQDGDGGALGGAAGLTPAANPERAIRASQAEATPNSHLTNVSAIVTGLRLGTAAGRRRIAGAVVADGARHLTTSEAEPGARRGAAPSTDYGRTAQLSEMPLARAGAAEGLVVHAYRGAPPTQPERRAAHAQNAYDGATWRQSHEALPLGSSKAPGEWRSQTQDPIVLGDAPDRVFGLDAEVSGYHGTMPMGPKSLRAGGWSDSANLTDEVGGFSDGIGTSA
jgi:hypothetical protein